MMNEIIGQIFKSDEQLQHWSAWSTDDLQGLDIVGIMAVAGHLLGYSSCVGAVEFNNRIIILAAKTNNNRESALSSQQLTC